MTEVIWLITSPRLPAGLLTAAAWDVLRSDRPVFAGREDDRLRVLRDAGVVVTVLPVEEAPDRLLTEGGVWLAGPDGDQELAHRLSRDLANEPSTRYELLYGSWDPPGARLLDVVAVIDHLRSPGGCPWDAAQTHESLAPYLLEEAYETVDAIASGDTDHLREELGDLLIQPLLHARFAAEDDPGFDIDDVAGDVVEKLIRRHPHVFGDERVDDVAQLGELWEATKRAEKPERRYATDGVATGQSALSLAAKYLSRVERAGVEVPVERVVPADADRTIGHELLRLVAKAHADGVDPELALRRVALDYAAEVRRVQDGEREDG
ncbi:MAG TPA: MazG family protein [Candidatus Stackebrandtia excrementipullorum]|nr:MazG family protein [Candidatus Stackebrandtia excrementipullorum]